MINEVHYLEVICDSCGDSYQVDISDSLFDINNNADILKALPMGWFAIAGNPRNSLCPSCIAKVNIFPQPKIGDTVYSVIDDKQRNLKSLEKYIVEDISHTQLSKDKYYKAIYVKTKNGGISVMYLG